MTRLMMSVAALSMVSGMALAEGATSPFAQPEQVWHLSELNGAPFGKESTLVFGAEGTVAGKALCNQFMGRAEWTPDSLSMGPLATTMMACPDLELERVVLQALSDVTHGAIVDERLVLTLQDGSELIYTLEQ